MLNCFDDRVSIYVDADVSALCTRLPFDARDTLRTVSMQAARILAAA
jgi:hypothetical protein